MATYTLDFEKPLLELEKQIEELKRVAGENAYRRSSAAKSLSSTRVFAGIATPGLEL